MKQSSPLATSTEMEMEKKSSNYCIMTSDWRGEGLCSAPDCGFEGVSSRQPASFETLLRSEASILLAASSGTRSLKGFWNVTLIF